MEAGLFQSLQKAGEVASVISSVASAARAAKHLFEELKLVPGTVQAWLTVRFYVPAPVAEVIAIIEGFLRGMGLTRCLISYGRIGR